MGKGWSGRDSGESRSKRGSRFDLFRPRRGAEPETAWTFQLPHPEFVAGSYEGRTFLQPSNHLGEDSAHRHHDPIQAIANGVVRYSGTASGYGRVVVIEHRLPDGIHLCSIYGHLCGHSGYPLIPKGSAVAPGEVVGYIGDVYENGDGREHLHLGLRKGAYDGVFCGYVRRPECTPRDYEEPTPFIAKRSGRMTLLGGLVLLNPATAVDQQSIVQATVRNGFFYGGALEFRLRLERGGGELVYSAVLSQRLAPTKDATLVFPLALLPKGRYAAVLEMNAPGAADWSEVGAEGEGATSRRLTVAVGPESE